MSEKYSYHVYNITFLFVRTLEKMLRNTYNRFASENNLETFREAFPQHDEFYAWFSVLETPSGEVPNMKLVGMLKEVISFIKLNREAITDRFSENRWTTVIKDDGVPIHGLLGSILPNINYECQFRLFTDIINDMLLTLEREMHHDEIESADESNRL